MIAVDQTEFHIYRVATQSLQVGIRNAWWVVFILASGEVER